MSLLSFGLSPCPNDCLMFYALIHRLFQDPSFDLAFEMADIEELNGWAKGGQKDILKMSVATFYQTEDTYELLPAGAAIGFGCGPLLVGKPNMTLDQITRVALPGQGTTANLLFSMAFGDRVEKKFYRFSDIEEAILKDEVSAGVIIHESRFSYETRGLVQLMDLGAYWEEKTQSPLPLGCLGVRKTLPLSIKTRLGELVAQSVRYGLENKDKCLPFLMEHAQDLTPQVIQNHCDLYVNSFSVDLGDLGQKAFSRMGQEISGFGNCEVH
jgi:1,4-dihydroxy-6-naphthoate synthase